MSDFRDGSTPKDSVIFGRCLRSETVSGKNCTISDRYESSRLHVPVLNRTSPCLSSSSSERAIASFVCEVGKWIVDPSPGSSGLPR